MPTVTLSESTFAELKSIADPSSDTPEAVAARLIHEEAVRRGIQSTTDGPKSAARVHVRTPRLAHPEQASDFRKQIVDL